MIKVKRMVMLGQLANIPKYSDLWRNPPNSDDDLIAWLEDEVIWNNLEDANKAMQYVVFQGEDGKYYCAYAVVNFEEVEPEQIADWQAEVWHGIGENENVDNPNQETAN